MKRKRREADKEGKWDNDETLNRPNGGKDKWGKKGKREWDWHGITAIVCASSEVGSDVWSASVRSDPIHWNQTEHSGVAEK